MVQRAGIVERLKDAEGREYFRGRIVLPSGRLSRRLIVPEPIRWEETASRAFVAEAQRRSDAGEPPPNAEVLKTVDRIRVPRAPGVYYLVMEVPEAPVVKIGWTGKTVGERLRKIEWLPYPTFLAAVEVGAPRERETYLHDSFSEHRTHPSKKEWFVLDGPVLGHVRDLQRKGRMIGRARGLPIEQAASMARAALLAI